MRALDAIGHALATAGSMTWQITWSLILGFTLSAVAQAVVRRETVARMLGDDKPKALARATGLGAASSSCSYAAVALARALFRRGASFTAAMAFEIASTNLVIELGIIMALLIGWQFTLAEFVGGPIMIVLVAVAFRLFVRQRLIDAAREQADKGLAGSMEGHAAMDMSIQSGGSFWHRLASGKGYTSVSHIFVMEWAAVIRDIIGGLLIAGAVAAWVPNSFWQNLFLTGHPLAAKLWGPIIGPVISMLSFVCSIGNVPLAAVLWNGGISFGGVVAFIFADLIIIPILIIYRKYYGTRMMLTILAHLLRHHGARRVHHRASVRRARAHSHYQGGQRRRDRYHLELHHGPQHHLPAAGRCAADPVLPFRRRRDAQDDGRQPRRARTPPCRSRARRARPRLDREALREPTTIIRNTQVARRRRPRPLAGVRLTTRPAAPRVDHAATGCPGPTGGPGGP